MATKPEQEEVETQKDDGLSPEERASLNEKDEGIEALDEIIAEADDPGEEEVVEEEAAEVAEDHEQEEEPEVVQDVADAPQYTPPAFPEPIDFEAASAELTRKANDGEIDITEYVVEQNALSEQRVYQKIAADMAQQAADRAWNEANAAFFDRYPECSSEVDPGKFQVLQAVLNQAATDPSSAGMSYYAILMKAKATFDKAIGAPAEKPTDPSNKEADKPKPRLVSDRSKLPPSLKDIPAAAAPPGGGGEFTGLDKLSGMDLEAAVARLSPEQQKRWAETG